MPTIMTKSNTSFSTPSSNLESELDQLLKLRTSLILDHPLNQTIGLDLKKLFLMFELYAHFVYDFSEYVCKLFIALQDEDLRAVIYGNLIDEMGLDSLGDASWEMQHGELYRQFILSLRRTDQYKATGLDGHINSIEAISKGIANRFYLSHAAIISEGNDLQSFAAFSTIECWVCDLYSFWKRSLQNMGESHKDLDIRTIDLHCICDVEHSATLDQLMCVKLESTDANALHQIKKGIIRGMATSEQLFADIHEEIVA